MKQLLFLVLLLLMGSTALCQSDPIHGDWLRDAGGTYQELMIWPNGKCALDGAIYQCWVRDGQFFEQTDVDPTGMDYAVRDNVLTLSGGTLERPLQFFRGQAGPVGPAGTFDPALHGTWVDGSDTLQFSDDGSAIYLGEGCAYTAGGQLLSFEKSVWDTWKFPYSIHGDTLLVMHDGAAHRYARISPATIPTQSLPNAVDLQGTWCSYGDESIASAVESDTLSPMRCFSLHLNGTTEWIYPELGQSFAGTWKYDGISIFFHLPTIGDVVYQLDKRNHPVTGRPLIIMGNAAYVGRYNHAPW